ncbi:10034_t:CDS:2, partial [Racocetra persica]
KATEIMSKESEQENRPENEPEDVISEVDNVDMLLENLSVENNPKVQELISNIKEYTNLIDQPVITKDILTDEAVEALEKVIRYQESLEVRKGFKENELMALRKKLKEWYYEKDKNKKQLSILSFFGLND